MSFEKTEDIDGPEFEYINKRCQEYGITWLPKKYHKRPRTLATLLDIFTMLLEIRKFIVKKEKVLVHCRGYVPAVAGLIANKLFKVPYIFDMRALWIDEIIENGTLNKKSLLAKSLYKLEGWMLRSASHIVSLTESAIPYLLLKHKGISADKFDVIPTCAAVEKFSYNKKDTKAPVIGTMGTLISGRIATSLIFDVMNAFKNNIENCGFKFITRDCPKTILMQNTANLDVDITSATKETINDELADLSLALVFFTPGVGTLGTSPTRLGEMFAAGIPVIVNDGVGDVSKIVDKYRVGIVLKSEKPEAINQAVQEALNLLKEPDIVSRCLYAAKDYYSLDAGVSKLETLYNREYQ
ncbi:glycosyltransferase [Thalassotalea aquiviva]|uniref:glycosyltransferase n=1 Tax=Thalassotalea aquiviva TaxID=3242415 RepID=UPI00352ACB29